MNTQLNFHYRDSGNNKESSGPYVLEGTFSKKQLADLMSRFGEDAGILIPNQIHPSFKNACPSIDGLDNNTHEREYDEEFDHCWHSIEIEETEDEPTVELTAKEFYKRVNSVTFDQMNY